MTVPTVRLGLALLLAAALAGCQTSYDGRTIATLDGVKPDLSEQPVDDSLVKAMTSYQRFLDETPDHVMAPEAMRRLADLQIEQAYGVMGDGSGDVIDLPAPESASASVAAVATAGKPDSATSAQEIQDDDSLEAALEARAMALGLPDRSEALLAADLPEGSEADLSGPRQAIATYQQILEEFPWYERNDQVLYQMARAYDELAQPEEAMKVVERLIETFPDSKYVDEVFFRRGEYFFVRRKFLDAEDAYMAVVAMGEASPFYELSLYKLGWSLYKQELYEDALHQYIALLDFKLSQGYDFDADYGEEDEGEERRVADTFRVISLSFSNLGGPDLLNDYFTTWGKRTYEDRIYRNLAEFHFDKRRFNDAAAVYQAFVELNPMHKVSPRFGMRVSEIYTEGNFPLLVVESKRDFATRYAVDADYWQYHDMMEMPDVVDYLKSNLIDLANHYHALYQAEGLEEAKPENYGEALTWYGEFLDSFPEDDTAPSINYQLADLLLEHGDFARSAREYERTAYDYPAHERAAEAGYAAIYAHRQNLEAVTGAEAPSARLATIDSSLRFAEVFPGHEHADTVLGAATEDLYGMQDFERAIHAGRWLIESYPDADIELRRRTWTIVAHSSFDTANYPDAEAAYVSVLSLTDEEDDSHQGIVDNLAASIYKQGEQARLTEDYAAAADHFLRIKTSAPTSEIRPAAEYDAAAALIKLENWLPAAEVLEDFRSAFPEHELRAEATRQLANVYEQAGDLSRSASEYELVAADATDPELRREAILVAADLYEQAAAEDDALRIYEGYLEEYPEPIETAAEIRFKVAAAYQTRGDENAYLDQLRAIVALDRDAGAGRTDRTRYLAANAALVLARPVYDEFEALALTQPFEKSLAEKQKLMDAALATFEALVNYGVGDVTAAATFYMAEIYGEFSDALTRSERPAGMTDEESAAYELVIEEEAFPFEEQSIAVHQENLELMRVGVYNEWIEKSLGELSVLMPGRYAKHEISGGLIGTIDQYAYRSPLAPEPVLDGDAELSDTTDQATLPELAGTDDAVIYP
jgi:tetratricopeptide (TPR) repeat protein